MSQEAEINKICYANLLESVNSEAVEEHLEHVREEGNLMFLVTGVINFWMDNSEEKKNAQNADLGLRKLATILDNLEAEEISDLIDNMHEHESVDLLTDFLLKDFDRLLSVYRSKKDEKLLLKLSFLLNFLDHENLLKCLGELTGEEIEIVMKDKKMRRIFEKLIDKILKHRKNALLDCDFLSLVSLALERAAREKEEQDKDKDKEEKPKLEEFKPPQDDLLSLLKNNQLSLCQLNMMASLQPLLILQLVRNYDLMPHNLKEAFKHDVVPMLEKSSMGKLCIDMLARKDPAMLNYNARQEVSAQKENQAQYDLSKANNQKIDNLVNNLDNGLSKMLEANSRKEIKPGQVVDYAIEQKVESVKEEIVTEKKNLIAKDTKTETMQENKTETSNESKVKVKKVQDAGAAKPAPKTPEGVQEILDELQQNR